ncbi:hypothetical protein B0T17DRAFT_587397 [Bombardia bombarda]|uniref:Methyltransferase n=1 Tax=Bombardia bombarda TaxID=252184 RepID=A0AA39XLB1_9PEZI|nr:hypothetical protein B0T17DRAFT_587397 [Bombardia bombarda]
MSLKVQNHIPKSNVKDETVQLSYIQWLDIFETEKPYEVISEVPPGLAPSNFSCSAAAPEVIHDIRGHEDSFNLEDHGFQVWTNTLAVTAFDKETVENKYLPSIGALLKEVFGPRTEAFVFDWRLSSVNAWRQIRSTDRAKSKMVPGAVIDLDDPLVCLPPVHAVHVDQSPWGAVNRVKHHMGECASELLRKRFRIINLWRPLHFPVENFPLAVCDGGTVPTEKLLAVDHVRKAYIGESLYPLPCPEYQWHYLSHQTRDEVLLFKTYDSATSARARWPEVKPRESIEVRALVFTEN